MRILVTGANGLVGSRLCRLLAARGHEVFGASRGERRAQGDFEYRACELSSEQDLAATFRWAQPEVVVNPASMTDVDGCERAPADAFAANVLGVRHLALEAKAANAHLVHVSTDYVFDGDAGPYSEQDLPNPRGVYALTKHMGEQAVRALTPSWTIARTAVVYGWPAAGRSNFGAWLVGALKAGEPVKLFEDQFVSPTLALNLCEMLAELAERKLGGLWHTSGAAMVNRVEFARALCEAFGFDPSPIQPVRMKELNLASPRPPRSGLKVDKARAELKAQPWNLAESLQRFHQEYRASTASRD